MITKMIFEEQETWCKLILWDSGRTATLTDLTSQYRRRGLARSVVKAALEYADWKDLEVFLRVEPFGDAPGMDAAELRAWYMTFGFIYQADGVMLRPRLSERMAQEGSE